MATAMLRLITEKRLFGVLWFVVKKQGSSPIEITTIKTNFLIFRLLVFFIFSLGMELGIIFAFGDFFPR